MGGCADVAILLSDLYNSARSIGVKLIRLSKDITLTHTHIRLNFVKSFVVHLSRFLSALLAFTWQWMWRTPLPTVYIKLKLSSFDFVIQQLPAFLWQQKSRMLALIDSRCACVWLAWSTSDMSSEITSSVCCIQYAQFTEAF